MGGTPVAAVVTLGLPRKFDPAFLDAIYDGMNKLARKHHVAIVGGETTTNPDRLLLSIALLGQVDRDKLVTRSGARPGDAIFVTGTLGGSLAGRHLEFEPRLEEARWLASHFAIHSMIDLSDGLAGDLRHVTRASDVGAELLTSSIPVSRAAKLAARSSTSSKPALISALTDGEDFELLFTIASRSAVRLLDGWKLAFPNVPLTCIGKVIPGSEIVLRDKNSVRPLTIHGFEHFA
jgi:thiamine-monophosphate kinase